MLPRHVTEQARAYFGTKYNMLHFVESKQSEWIATHICYNFRKHRKVGTYFPMLVKGTPLKPRRCAVSDFESREYYGSATDRRSQPAASQRVYSRLKRSYVGTSERAAHRKQRVLITLTGKGD